jgi:hypothetical protein
VAATGFGEKHGGAATDLPLRSGGTAGLSGGGRLGQRQRSALELVSSGTGFGQGSRSEQTFMVRREAPWQPDGGWHGAWHQVETGFRCMGPSAGRRRPTSGTVRQKNPELKTLRKRK